MGKAGSAEVALLRRLFESVNRHDVAGIVGNYHPDVTLAPPPLYTSPGTAFYGHAGVESLARELLRRAPRARFEPHEFRAVGDRQLVRASFTDDGESPDTRDVTFLYRIVAGKIVRGAGFATEADAWEAAERPTEHELGALLHEAPAAIAILDEEGRFRDANPAACALFGLGVDDLRGRAISQFVPFDSVDRLERFLAAVPDRAGVVGRFTVASHRGERHASVEFRARGGLFSGRRATILVALDEPPDTRLGATRRLTPRQREIFTLLALGLTAPEIADRLCISRDTVRTHVQNGTISLDARNRLQAVVLALRRGEIELEGEERWRPSA